MYGWHSFAFCVPYIVRHNRLIMIFGFIASVLGHVVVLGNPVSVLEHFYGQHTTAWVG